MLMIITVLRLNLNKKDVTGGRGTKIFLNSGVIKIFKQLLENYWNAFN